MTERTTLFSIIMFNKDEEHSIYAEEYSLRSFSYFKRTPVQEMLRFLSKRVVQNVETDKPQELIHKVSEGDSYKFFIKERSNYIFVLSSLLEYPSNTLSLLIEDINKYLKEEIQDIFKVSHTQKQLNTKDKDKQAQDKLKVSEFIKKQLKEYQNYEQKDIMLQIKNELGMVEEILSKTVESALGRGEKIDELISSADSLSFQTKSLYKLSKKQNKKCCGII
ncbi:synaptobrevin-like protein YKT6 [Nematocida sp. AWRm80]|nr:synaptobrevin-like protein YKT6 [Nematocida sp. AWRm80]